MRVRASPVDARTEARDRVPEGDGWCITAEGLPPRGPREISTTRHAVALAEAMIATYRFRNRAAVDCTDEPTTGPAPEPSRGRKP
jgi:hypothetical protein